MQTVRRIPGFRFDVQPPPLVEILPRMDVAVFIGFAASGPLDIPVLVEDAAYYSMIFGRDAVLAWDAVRGESMFAYLGPAVRAFFRNGGKRCWVIRVAGPKAHTNRFPIHGLVQFNDQLQPQPVALRARCEGSWSDKLEVATQLAAEPLTAVRWELAPTSDSTSEPRSFRLELDTHHTVGAGDLLRLTFLGNQLGEEVILLLAVKLPTAEVTHQITEGTAFWFSSESPEPSELPPEQVPALRAVERLTFDLHVRQGHEATWVLRNLGFAPGHSRYVGLLPSDEELFQSTDAPDRDRRTEFQKLVANPRFPLAAESDAGLSLPLGMSLLGDQFVRLPKSTLTGLERDGLERFDADLFFGGDRMAQAFVRSSTASLLADADFLRYQADKPARLKGIYAALEIEEATLIAVPDAVHRGWAKAAGQPPEPPVESKPPVRPEWWHFLACPLDKDLPLVRQPEPGHFLNCDLQIVTAPTLSVAEPPDGSNSFALAWTEVADATYVLEESTSPMFNDARVIHSSTTTRFVVRGRSSGDYYYRVRAVIRGTTSDYSNGVVVRITTGVEDWHLLPVEKFSDLTLVAIQRALLRLCAARADLIAVLSLPEHYAKDESTAHVITLTSAEGPAIAIGPARVAVAGDPVVSPISRPLSYEEAIAFSFGALYHPWLVGREETSTELRRAPPDGAATGMMARRALTRGAWIAPANETLSGVVAVTPALPRQSRLGFLESQINLLCQEPHGLVAQSADTLSSEPDLRPINVRRLLVLLRRLALRVGVAYAFEPIDDSLRRTVESALTTQLENLFMRGAFAGRTAEASFQVLASPSLNTPQSVDQGRFVVEIRVAPSLPLIFLTIRLVQSADRGVLTEVR